MKYVTKRSMRTRRHMRLRKKIFGSAERPRLSVCFTLKHGYAQFIDDDSGKTITYATTLAKDFPEQKMKGVEKAKTLGEIAAKKAVESGIKSVVFDRGGFRYHGKVKSFADAARKAGLQF